MKILHVVNRLFPGGAQTMLLSLLRKEKELGYEPMLLSLKNQNMIAEQISALGVQELTLDIKRFVPSPSKWWTVPKKIRDWQPDVVQAWMYHSDVAAMYLRYVSRIKAPMIWSIHHSIHSLETEKRNTRFVIKTLKKIDWMPYKTVFVSRTSAEQHVKLGYREEKMEIIPNGFDLVRFQPNTKSRHSIRQELKVDDSTRLVGIFGRFHPVKDFPNFLSACGSLVADSRFDDVRFVLCGRDQSPENAELASLVQENGLENRVFYLGQRNDVADVYAAMDLVVNSSRSEAFPMTIGEAMATGIPCVVTGVGDCPWLVGETGKIVPPRDSKALATGMQQILSLAQDARIQIGLDARQRIQELFSLDSVSQQYHDLYREAIEDSGR